MVEKRMVFQSLRGIVPGKEFHLVLHTSQTPLPQEWANLMAVGRSSTDLSNACWLVLSDGGGPDAGQRSLLADLQRSKGSDRSHVAIISRSLLMRAIATALALFNPNLKIFDVKHLKQALAYLGVRPQQSLAVAQAIRAMCKELPACSSAKLVSEQMPHDAAA